MDRLWWIARSKSLFIAEVFGEAQDHHLIPPVLDGAKENMEAVGCGKSIFAGKTFTADSNYHDPTNLRKCDEEGLDAYIPDKRFRRRDSRFESRIQTDSVPLSCLPWLTSNDMRKEMNMFAQMEKSLAQQEGSCHRRSHLQMV